jgi:uncharacterized protein YegL
MCNEQACVGDEICVAHQDLILMVDGSGSLKSSGFEILRTFAANLTDKYKPEMWGKSDARIGVVLFGNGAIEQDGSISWGLQVQGLTADMADTKAKITAMTWQRGFTNMAQGFTMADKMLGEQGREDAQSAVMVITDAKLNFEFQTEQQARALHDKNVMVFMVPVTEYKGDELKFLKEEIASQPWETNFLRIPGLLALENNEEMFLSEAVAKFCPRAISPSSIEAEAERLQYVLVREQSQVSAECTTALTYFGLVLDADDCAAKARENNETGFWYGHRYEGWRQTGIKYCYGLEIPVTDERWNSYIKGDNPNPDVCDQGMVWPNPYYDIYALKPLSLIGA